MHWELVYIVGECLLVETPKGMYSFLAVEPEQLHGKEPAVSFCIIRDPVLISVPSCAIANIRIGQCRDRPCVLLSYQFPSDAFVDTIGQGEPRDVLDDFDEIPDTDIKFPMDAFTEYND